ncbi:hypothetical protein GQ600_24963 [Phytophthora cactorum]|nr:hypothetical protein GQ600_24963 [Phytophthora cactorum]
MPGNLAGTSGRENFELNYAERAAFSDAELLDVLTGIDAGGVQGCLRDFMESLGSDDDVGVLRASDGSLSENTSSASSPPPMDLNSKRKGGTTANATMPVPSNVKPKRKRRKHELDHLRAVAAELEKKLNVLNRDEGQPDANHFWKHISNQLMTERQRTVGRTLDCGSLFGSSSGVGNLLLQQPCMPAPSLVGKRKMNMEMETDGECGPQMCLQFVESRLIPCSLLRIGDHAWDFLSGSNSHEDFQMALQNQGNEMFGHCTVTNPSGSRQSLGNIAVRRYYESNKLTFVWECDGLCSHDGAASSMHVHQKGWCVFEPTEEDPQNATIFRACVRMTPTLADSSNSFTDSAKAVGQTTEIVIENYEKTVVYIFDAVLASLACEAPHNGQSRDEA